MISETEINGILIAVGIIIGSIFMGYFIHRVLFSRILKLTARRKLTNSRIVARQIQALLSIWLVLGSIYLDFFLISENIISVPIDSSSLEIAELITRFLVLLSVIYFVNRLIGGFLEFYIRKGKLPTTTIFGNLTKIFLFFLGISIILASYGISIAPIIATLGVGGLAIALALQDTLSSLFAGIYILLSKQINPGDYIRLETGQEGTVQDINWRNTTIRTRENNIIIVPNRNLSGFLIINFSLIQEDMSVVIPVGVHYDSDLDLVKEVTLKTAKEILTTIPGGVVDFEPLIRFTAFGESAITFNVILRAQNYTSQFLLRHEFIYLLRKKYAENDINIPYPMRTLSWDKGGSADRLDLG